MDVNSLQRIALSMRSLTIDAIQKANSGHPGLPLGAAELGAFLYGEEMNYDPSDTSWLNRDRFVLSAGHGSMFLYSILHLAGFPLTIDDIAAFRQVGSKCPGHPEYRVTPGVETTTGPLGQGVANAVGMAIAERMMAAHFNTAESPIFDHYTYALVGDGCLEEGVASEACSLAGALGLGKLIVYYDSNSITIDGPTSLTFTEDVGKRFEAYGWQVLRGDMYDFEELKALTAAAKAEKNKPSIIILKSIIGKGSPNKQGTAGIHGSPLGTEEAVKAKAGLGIPQDTPFWVAPEAYAYFEEHRKVLAAKKAEWQKMFEAWKKANPGKATELDAWYANKPSSEPIMPVFAAGSKVATRNASGECLGAVAKAWQNLVGGSADLTGPNVTQLPTDASSAPPDFSRDNPAGRYIHFGIREHGMAAVANGLALYGGVRPFVATFLVFADYMRPAIRLAALMKLPVLYVLTHDSIFIGEDGPTHQPVESLTALRTIPGLTVLRPADAEETAVAWLEAIKKTDGPVALVLSRQNLPVVAKADPDWTKTMKLGAYIVRNPQKAPDLTLVASGSEVSLALKAADLVAEKKPGLAIRVVSIPCREAFFGAAKAVQEVILGPQAKVFVAEAGIGMGWERIAPHENIFSIERFGESGPGDKVAEHLGFTAEKFADKILATLA
ncbi:MAG TPA: transketolase [Spirochaetales bacterium]|nr:transketolase [Spirochaetales bacterium]HPS15254.1 transketolase [Spirochaetales bacterium]